MKKIYKVSFIALACIASAFTGAIINNPTELPFANHKTAKAVANYDASDLVPFTDWNDIYSQSKDVYKCSGGQVVTINSIFTQDKPNDSNSPTLVNGFSFLSVSQNGFVVAKNDIPVEGLDYNGFPTTLYTGEEQITTSAKGINSNGKEVKFTFYDVYEDTSGASETHLVLVMSNPNGADISYTCKAFNK